MAVPDCIIRRTLGRSRTSTNQRFQVVCREALYLCEILRYTRDLGSSVYFPHTVFNGDDLYDVTLSDGDCRLRLTLDPRLNGLAAKHVLRRGVAVRNAIFAPAMTGLADRTEDHSFLLASVEVSAWDGSPDPDPEPEPDWDSLPWSGSSDVSGPLLANRKLFLPLWNNVDFQGHAWRKTPPPGPEEEGPATVVRPTTTIKGLRRAFLAGEPWVRGGVQRRLVVRITAKSRLTYFGSAGRNCALPYQARMEARDPSGSVSLVLWNSACVDWYRLLKPGSIISLSRFCVKQQYLSERDDIEISVNSRNPAARLALLAEASVAPDCLPPVPAYDFCDSEELASRPHGAVCDVVGLLTFIGRAERTRKGSELLEYRWLRLRDGRSSRPIWIQLFSTSQPHVHCNLRPLSVLVCCRAKVVQTVTGLRYLTNTPFTQLQRSGKRNGCGRLPAARRFLDWFRQQDEEELLRSALIGGFFCYPPPPVSLEAYMRSRQGEPGFIQGMELVRELEKLCYRERRSFCIQATVTMVTYCRRGEEEHCIFWQDASWSLPSAPASSPGFSAAPPPTPGTGRSCKRKLQLHSDTPQKGRPRATVQPEGINKTALLFEASMEFLQNTDEEDEAEGDEGDGEGSSYATCPSPPDFPRAAAETLSMRYHPARGKKQLAAAAMGGGSLSCDAAFDCDRYFTLKLKALSDDACISAIFLPQSSSSSLSPPRHSHANTWASILSHGAFSSHAPPPSPGDLIAAAAAQLANQRLVCLLDACNLGGDSNEVAVSRAFPI